MQYDFYGFRFAGVHSSDLNIIRVSDGSRYNEITIPSFQDHTESVTGGDGTLYWESFYTNRTWEIQIAFDSLTESQLRQFRQVFNAKTVGKLIFDELPFKAYTAKIQNPPQLSFICFDIPNQGRIYKGEGTIQFVAYYPYAQSVYKFLSQYESAEEDYDNIDQWKESSGMKSEQGDYDGSGYEINLYNAGDIPTDWQAFYPIDANGSGLQTILLNDGDGGIMSFSSISRKNNNDAYIRVNSRTNLIEGCNANKELTGSIYNEFLIAGDFFKIPLGESTFDSNVVCSEIKYNYLYY